MILKSNPFSCEFYVENSFLSICVGVCVGHPPLKSWYRSKETPTSFDINVVTGGDRGYIIYGFEWKNYFENKTPTHMDATQFQNLGKVLKSKYQGIEQNFGIPRISMIHWIISSFQK